LNIVLRGDVLFFRHKARGVRQEITDLSPLTSRLTPLASKKDLSCFPPIIDPSELI
jgi:hypothetical protein